MTIHPRLSQAVVKLWQNKTIRLFVPYSNFTSSSKLLTLPLRQALIYNCFFFLYALFELPPHPKIGSLIEACRRTFCENNDDDEEKMIRERKSLFIRNSRLELHSIRALTPHHTPRGAYWRCLRWKRRG